MQVNVQGHIHLLDILALLLLVALLLSIGRAKVMHHDAVVAPVGDDPLPVSAHTAQPYFVPAQTVEALEALLG